MSTINISLPDKLKSEAKKLISEGHYVSFSDLIRTAVRRLLSEMAESKYDLMADEAIEEYKKGKGTLLESNQDVDEYVKKITRS